MTPNFWENALTAEKKISHNVCIWLIKNIFQAILSNFRPVFRYFFFESFTSPEIWFKKRQNYIRSLATSSIIGYILGLGDRHTHNILIDENTAELIHIDLGIAFERGKLLPTPEMIPFRLTQVSIQGAFERKSPQGFFKLLPCLSLLHLRLGKVRVS